ncbi:hypothetical protein F5Y11DRAFT_362476 [Daldinia sp. FL1419]|nr:hypothetical protein F5Y11DRAFT_362476 [Daldinia sp. FL1419]
MSASDQSVVSAHRPPAPSAATYIPVNIDASREVLDATFVSNTIPDINPNSGVVGLCAVPHDRAGIDDLGWHIADFLAFKALLCGETPPKSQTWFSQCDIVGIVKSNPQRYLHGKESRLVNVAAVSSSYTDGRGRVQERDDHIKVETSTERLIEDFLTALSDKAQIAKEKDLPLTVIICGLTTLEQDVFFEENNSRRRVTSERIREVLGNHVDAVVITPALFSAGWMVNPSFCRPPAGKVRADRTEFLARQFGAIFSKDFVDSFSSWSCPFIDWDHLHVEKDGKFPGPLRPSRQQQDAIVAFKVKIHNILAGRFSPVHGDHSLNFDAANDEWQKLVGPRQYKPLSYFRQKWENLGLSSTKAVDETRLEFLGGAFGGNRASQEKHIKHLIYDSFTAWPGYWALPFGRSARAAFTMFLKNDHPDYRDCQEIFNIMEHRSTSAIVADTIFKYFGLPKPYGERCRDWDELKWTKESADITHLIVNRLFGEISKYIPGVNVPPGVNPNHLSVIQRRLEVPASYLSVAIYDHSLAHIGLAETMIKSIVGFMDEIKDRQIELLLKNPELYDKCSAWLNSIHLPIRRLCHTIPTVKSTELSEQSPDVPSETSRGLVNQEVAMKHSTAIIPTRRAAEPVPPAQPKAGAKSNNCNEIIIAKMKELLPHVNFEEGIEILKKEKADLIVQLMSAPQEELVELQKKIRENENVLTMMEELARQREEKSKSSSHGSEKCIGAISSSVSQDASNMHGHQSHQSPSKQLPPHLRRSLEKLIEQSDTKPHTRRHLEEPTKTKARDVLQLSSWRDTSGPPNETRASPVVSRTAQQETKAPEQFDIWIPPHLRGLRHTD